MKPSARLTNTPCLHWSSGGTGLTNFDPQALTVYQLVIDEFERLYPKLKGLFWIEKRCLDNPAQVTHLYSLHRDDKRTPEDTEHFWRIFKSASLFSLTKGYSINKEFVKECSLDVY